MPVWAETAILWPTIKLVYDAKQTNQPSVPADKINLPSLEDFRSKEGADFGFFVAIAYAGENDPNGKLNRLVTAATTDREDPQPVTLLKLDHLRRIVGLHYRYGVTPPDSALCSRMPIP